MSDSLSYIDFRHQPATDEWFAVFRAAMPRPVSAQGPFYFDWIAEDAFSRLTNKGLFVTTGQIGLLFAVCEHLADDTRVLWSAESQKRELSILKASEELLQLIGQRHDSEFYEIGVWNEDKGKAELDTSLEVKKFVADLETVRRTAEIYLENLKRGADERKKIGNRALFDRHFYWLYLLGMWKHGLKREIKLSQPNPTSGGNSYGPLVTFIMAMSDRGFPAGELREENIFAWVRRRKNDDLPGKEFWI